MTRPPTIASLSFRFAITCLVAILVIAPARADELMPVDLELVLAIDISGSIDDEEAQLQREGFLAALVHPDVVAAIKSGMLGKIAVTYVEWAGHFNLETIIDWTLIEDAASARAFAGKLAASPLQTGVMTSISGVINYVMPVFEENAFEGTRKVIDISGDGPNNTGGYIVTARDRAVASGLIINGLPIVNDRPSRGGFPAMPNLDLYYINCVIGGPGAFIVVADTFRDFARAIQRKLILEIAGRQPAPSGRWTLAGPPRAGIRPARTPIPCDIGERRFRQFMKEMGDTF